MEQRGAAPAFRKVQRPHDHSLPRTAAAMEPGEWEWLQHKTKYINTNSAIKSGTYYTAIKLKWLHSNKFCISQSLIIRSNRVLGREGTNVGFKVKVLIFIERFKEWRLR